MVAHDTEGSGQCQRYWRGVRWRPDYRFNANAESLCLDDRNWPGDLSPTQVVDRHGHVQNGDVVFDFGGGNKLVLTGVSNLDGITDALTII